MILMSSVATDWHLGDLVIEAKRQKDTQGEVGVIPIENMQYLTLRRSSDGTVTVLVQQQRLFFVNLYCSFMLSFSDGKADSVVVGSFQDIKGPLEPNLLSQFL